MDRSTVAPVYVLRKAGADLAWNGFRWVALDAKPFRYTRREYAEREARALETTATWIETVDGEPANRPSPPSGPRAKRPCRN